MSAQEMPEWFKKICADAYKDNLFLADVFDHIFLEISKPERAAKIPEVAELIKEAQSMVDKVENDYSTSWLEEALAPFKGGE